MIGVDSFYSSQGRLTSFPDHNEKLIEHLMSSVENLATFEVRLTVGVRSIVF